MLRGIESFKNYFKGFEKQYTIIGGAACDLLMSNAGLDFRATKDIDLVLIIEMIDTSFIKTFWDYVKEAGYEHHNKISGQQEFYRFTNPRSKDYPMMIELFSRRLGSFILPEDAALSPLPIDDDISSLSVILLNDDYYAFLKEGQTIIDGINILDALHLIPFKAKAWIDLNDRKNRGEQVDSKNIRKHKNDILD